MKVLLFSPLALENGRGGEISLMELASGLQEYYDITLFDTNRYIGDKILSAEAIRKKLNGVERNKQIKFATFTIFNKSFSFPYPGEIIRFFRICKKNEIIYSSISNLKINLMLILFTLLNRRPKFIIGFRRPLYSEKIISFYNIKYRTSILLLGLFKKRFHFHTISGHAKEFLENFYESKKISHIIHGVNLEDFIKSEKEDREINTLNFLYVGFIDDIHKGVGVLIEAIEQVLKENEKLPIFFEFCGTGPLESRLKRLQERYPDFVRYNGYISNKEIPEYYKKNDIFLFTSRREPFGRVMIEALASNLLIICTKTYGSVEVLKGKNFAFFLSELSSDAIKEKIYTIYDLWKEKRELFKELQESAKLYAIQNYSFSIELEMFRKLIHNLALNKI